MFIKKRLKKFKKLNELSFLLHSKPYVMFCIYNDLNHVSWEEFRLFLFKSNLIVKVVKPLFLKKIFNKKANQLTKNFNGNVCLIFPRKKNLDLMKTKNFLQILKYINSKIMINFFLFEKNILYFMDFLTLKIVIENKFFLNKKKKLIILQYNYYIFYMFLQIFFKTILTFYLRKSP